MAPPAPPAPGAPLNLDVVRPRFGPMNNQGMRGVVPLLPPPPERKSKLAEDIEKAGKPDCRTAHRDKGLLGVVPLVADSVRDGGCRW